MRKDNNLIMFGWREWISLPELKVPAIKAKIDTGARTSAIHTCKIEEFSRGGIDYVRFFLHPLQNSQLCLERVAPVVDKRIVSDSGGHREKRIVIKTLIAVKNESWPIEITLTNRDKMRFRMLLGRTAMHHKVIINPSLSYACGKINGKRLY